MDMTICQESFFRNYTENEGILNWLYECAAGRFWPDKNIFKETWNEYQDFVTGTKGRNEFFSDDILKPVYEKIQKIAVRDVEEDLIYIAEMYLRNLWKGQINSLHNNSFTSIEIVSGMENYFMDIRENKVAKIRYSVNQEPEVFYLPAYHLLDLVNKPAFASVTHSTESDLQSALMSQKQSRL